MNVPIEDIARHLEHSSETWFETKEYTIFLCDSTNGIDISVYPLGTKPNDDGEFDDSLRIDGGMFEADSELDAVKYALSYMD